MVFNNKLKKIIQTIIEVALVIFLINYFFNNRNELHRIFDISIQNVSQLIVIVLLSNIFRSFQLKEFLKILGGKISILNAIWLTVGSTLLNYLPMNIGMIIKARALKKTLGIKYAYFASLTIVDILFIMVSGSIMAFVSLLFGSNNFSSVQVYGFIFFTVVIFIALVLLFLPAKLIPNKENIFLDIIRDYMIGVHQIKKNLKNLFKIFLIVSFRLVLITLQFLVCFKALNANVTIYGCMLFV